MRLAKKLFIATLILLFASIAFAQNVSVMHEPVSFASMGKPILIEAYLDGAGESEVLEAVVRFRTVGDDAYDYADLMPSANKYVGEIPIERISEDGVEYFIEFTLESGEIATYPSGGADTPKLITVKGAVGKKAESPVMVISPEPETSNSPDEVLVAVAFNPAVMQIDPSRVVLKVNGSDQTSNANISEYVLTAVLTGFGEGRHRIDILYKNDNGMDKLAGWNFVTRAQAQKTEGRTYSLKGNAELQGVYQNINDNSVGIARAITGVRYRTGKFSVAGRLRLTSEESKYLQPQNRYMLSVGHGKWFKLRVGDINPRYSELILWGRRVRGTELQFNFGGFNLWGIYGDMARAVDTRGYIDPVNGFVPSTIGTYKRWVAGSRISFGSPKNLMFGLTTFKIKDDNESIEYGERPEDNLVTGMDVEFTADRRRINFRAEAALSLYNSNTNEGVLSDAEDFKDIIWINQYFEPLPDQGLPTEENGDELKVGELAKSIISNALSYKARLRLRYFYNDFQFTYRFINNSYLSLGNSSMKRDRAGFALRDRIRLFQSKVYLNLLFSTTNDNVTDKGDLTTDWREMGVGVTYYTPEMYPDVVVSYRNLVEENNGAEEYINSGTSIDTVDTRLDNATGSVNFSLDYRRNIADTENRFLLSYQTMNRSDAISPTAESGQNAISLSAHTKWDMLPLETTVQVMNSSMKAMDEATDLSSTSLMLRGEYYLLNRKLVPYFSPRFQFSSGPILYSTTLVGDPATTVKFNNIDYTKIDWQIGMTYNFLPNQSIEGYFIATTYSENGEYEYWDGHTVSVKDDAAYLERNNMIGMIRYFYRF